MKRLRGLTVFVAALALTLLIVLLQMAWNLHSPDYLRGVAQRANTNQAVAAVLPDYAASKLPEPDSARASFSQHVTASSVQEMLDTLYVSITHAYVGKTDTVDITITSITVPVKANGYQIPPGTAFANDTVQVGGLAGILRITQKSLIPSLCVAIALLVAAVLVGIKRGIVPALRNILLVTCLLLGGIAAATLVVPSLVSSLVASSGLDAGLRSIVLDYINVLIADAGRYYLGWMVLLLAVVVIMSIWSSIARRARRPGKKNRKASTSPDIAQKEL